MESTPREIQYYRTKEGKVPFSSWLDSLSVPVLARVLTRLERVKEGNFGDHKPVGQGVFEMRLNFGPGYRAYYALVDGKVVLLLVGGEKGTQDKDIKLSHKFLMDYKSNS